MSSIGATVTPRRANTCMPNLTSWPILSDARRLEQRLQERDRVLLADLVGGRAPPPPSKRSAGADAMAERDIAGLVRARPQARRRRAPPEADRSTSPRRRRRRARVSWARAIHGRSSSRLVDGLVGGPVDRRLRLRRPRASEIGRRRRLDRGGLRRRRPASARPPRPARALRACSPLRPCQPAGPTKRGSGSIADDVDAADLADPSGDRGELHRLEEGDELACRRASASRGRRAASRAARRARA